ncbi:uncharacterized protein LOC111028218 [Myzus persicae]|nr:uncharacterized protein LOC111028218 [Myzus persicae]
MKLFRLIKNSNDTSLLQDDLSFLANWCDINKLPLNFEKCKVMSFTRSRNPITHTYSLRNHHLHRVNEFCDLGVIFESDLTFNHHIQHIINNSSSILGFITRNCKDFNNHNTLKILFMSLVRSKLEYNSTVWSPYLNTQIQCIENVQNRFLRFMSYKCNIIRVPHSSYQPLLNTFNIQSLANRRKVNDLLFLFKLLNGFFYCPELLSFLNFSVPQVRTRSSIITTFYINNHKTNYALSAPINRMMAIANDEQIDFFNFCPNSVDFFNSFVRKKSY